MKKRNHTQIIRKLIDLLTTYRPTAHEFRYITQVIRCKLCLQIPKRPKRLPDVLTDAEIYHFLKIASDLKPTVTILCNILLFTGLRINEVRNLDVRDIDWGGNVLKVVAGKGNKDRFVPIPLGLQDKIKIYLNKRQSGHIIAKSDGKPYTKRALQYMVTKTINLSKFSDKSLHPHSLRHTYATLMLRKGLHKDKLQVIMGHSSIKTTEIYTRMELGDTTTEVIKLMGYE